MNDLLDTVMEAHGGLANWETVSLINFDLDIRGNILLSKCLSPLPRRYSCTIDPDNIEVILDSYPIHGSRGIYRGSEVQILNSADEMTGRKLIDRAGLTRQRVWDDLDLLYFFGYAIWNYALTPFIFRLPGFICEELEPWQHKDGENVRRLKVTFPDSIPTHCREQTFYFNKKGLLIRLDYTADVFGQWAKGAHMCTEHRKFDKFIFPTRRKIYGAWFPKHPIPFLTAIQGIVSNVRFAYR